MTVAVGDTVLLTRPAILLLTPGWYRPLAVLTYRNFAVGTI